MLKHYWTPVSSLKEGGGREKGRGGRGLVSLILGYSYNYKRFLLLVKSVAKKKSYARKKIYV